MAGGFRSWLAFWLGGAGAVPPAAGEIALVQSASAYSNVCAFTGPPAAGNLLIAMFSWASTETITGVADTASNTWAAAGTVQTGGTNRSVQIWYCYNCATATPHTVTATFTAETGPQMHLSEWSGALTTDPYGGSNGAASDSQADPYDFGFGSVTPTEDGCLVVSVTRGTTFFTIDGRASGWAALTGLSRSDTQYVVQTTAGATDGQISFEASEVVAGKIAWFKPAPAGAGTGARLAAVALYYARLRG